MSSANGLLRYCIGDIVQVTRKVCGVPFIEYQGRLDGSLSAVGEKMSETHFRDAITHLRDFSHNIEA